MEFFNTAFVFLAPILILLSFILKNDYKTYALNVLAVVNVLLILHSIDLVRTLYGYYQLATIMGFEIYPNNKFVLGWLEVRIILVVLLPLLFLMKKLSAERWLSIAMMFLLLFDIIKDFIAPSKGINFSVITFAHQNLSLQILHYTSWLIAIYALFWLIKKLPSQKTINHKL